MELLDFAKKSFATCFGAPATHAGIAPGRVEVLGNHTDYNEGYILSAAIDRQVVVCGRKIAGDRGRLSADEFTKICEFSVSNPQKDTVDFWVNYLSGVVAELNKRGVKLGGFEAIMTSNVPLGSGLSSSAAIEVATLNFLQALYPFAMDKIEIARTTQAAENNFVGVNCGILDQFSSVMGKRDQLIFLDCRNLKDYAHLPLGDSAQLVIANTHAKHSLADGTYNRLREACFTAAKFFAEKIPAKKITHLRDVTFAEFKEFAGGLDPAIAKKAKHIITENERVLKGVAALKKGDLKTMGECMSASHCSSRDDFGNSCKELDVMFDCADGLTGLYGRRLSGGGFGGCTVNLVAAEHAKTFAQQLAENYEKKTSIKPTMHLCRAADGATQE